MGGCNCVRSQTISREIDTTLGNLGNRETALLFLQNEHLLETLIRIQSRFRGIQMRNQVKVRSKAKTRQTPATTPVYNSKIPSEELQEVCNNYPVINDDVNVVLRNPIEFENQSVFYGEWNSETNQRHGRGIQVWLDGSKYEGYWQNDKANLKGKFLHYNGDYYDGEWLNDKAQGYGNYYHVDGAVYEGQWKDNKQDGIGKERWPDGSVYQGSYRDGLKNGHGVFRWVDESMYDGEFVDNKINGRGVYIWKNQMKYDGNWVDNKMEGKGVFTWPDNRRYEGQYKNDKKEGFGLFEWPDGRKYRGYWKEGKQHGEGEIYIPKKDDWKKGLWEHGKRTKLIEEEE